MHRKNGTDMLNHIMAGMMIFTSVLILTYVLVIPGVKLVRAVRGNTYEILSYDADSDFIRLNDIEKQDISLVDVPSYFDDNFISRSKHVLYNQYNVCEEFKVTGEEWYNSDYYPSFRMYCYEVTTKGLADKLIGDVVKLAENKHNWPLGMEVSINKVKYDGLDEAYLLICDFSGLYTLVARKDSTVVDIMYYGKKPYDELLEVVAGKL